MTPSKVLRFSGTGLIVAAFAVCSGALPSRAVTLIGNLPSDDDSASNLIRANGVDGATGDQKTVSFTTPTLAAFEAVDATTELETVTLRLDRLDSDDAAIEILADDGGLPGASLVELALSGPSADPGVLQNYEFFSPDAFDFEPETTYHLLVDAAVASVTS